MKFSDNRIVCFKDCKSGKVAANIMDKALLLQSVISTLEDPRQQAQVRYPLGEILLLSLFSVICGCESFVDINRYGLAKLEFLRKLDLLYLKGAIITLGAMVCQRNIAG